MKTYNDRFKQFEQQKQLWLKNLSLRKALEIEEKLLCSQFIWEWRRNFLEDNPVSCIISLKKK